MTFSKDRPPKRGAYTGSKYRVGDIKEMKSRLYDMCIPWGLQIGHILATWRNASDGTNSFSQERNAQLQRIQKLNCEWKKLCGRLFLVLVNVRRKSKLERKKKIDKKKELVQNGTCGGGPLVLPHQTLYPTTDYMVAVAVVMVAVKNSLGSSIAMLNSSSSTPHSMRMDACKSVAHGAEESGSNVTGGNSSSSEAQEELQEVKPLACEAMDSRLSDVADDDRDEAEWRFNDFKLLDRHCLKPFFLARFSRSC